MDRLPEPARLTAASSSSIVVGAFSVAMADESNVETGMDSYYLFTVMGVKAR